MLTSPFRLLRFSKPERALQSTYQHLPTCKPIKSSWTGLKKRYSTSTERLPRVAQPSLWQSLVPKGFRGSAELESPSKLGRSKEWNPATFFIFIFLLIGSNAIQMITLRHEYTAFSRKADAKIALLQDVLDRVQRGQDVDVEKVLGTGDEVQEQEWKDVLRNVEKEDQLWQSKARRREKKQSKGEEKVSSSSMQEFSSVTEDYVEIDDALPQSNEPKRSPRFY